MKPKKIIWQIFPANLLILVIALVSVTWYGATSIEEFFLDEAQKGLEARCNLIKKDIADLVREQNFSELRELAITDGREAGMRITVVDSHGVVLADSSEDPLKMNNHSGRPEIAKAFQGQTGSSLRLSKTLNDTLLYVAIPIYLHERKEGSADVVLRCSFSVASLYANISQSKQRVAVGSSVIVAFAVLVTLLISRNISRPLEEIRSCAERFSKGDFSKRMKQSLHSRNASLEVVSLASTMDRMAELLDEKIGAIVTHRNQLETVFSSMVEAVIAIDTEERVISINDAAAKLFKVDKKESRGKIVQQIVRNLELQQRISHILTSRESVETEIVLNDGGEERFLQTNVVTLYDGNGESVGVLVVLNDVTRLRKLETVRRDFVANVSHELRTPITSIKGYVETLLDGALDNREDAERFLQIVLRQSTRLNAIIDDLLALSRIEQESSNGNIQLERISLCGVLDVALQTCQMKAHQENVKIELNCPKDICLMMNPTLLEQAVVNLVVNAIKYSESGGVVTVAAQLWDNGEKVRISVLDRGCGVGREHLPRLFERFYRSDKSRSRSHGGTGLGLAIVKHIVQAHEGTIDVKSEKGVGSEFTMILPC